MQQAAQSGLPVSPINLLAPFPKSLAEASFYDDFMLDRRIGMARDFSLDLTKVVMDGNLKLCPKYCAREVAQLVHCPQLNAFTVTPCSRTPARKRKHCALHSASLNPDERGPPQEEAIVSHRRLRRLLSDPQPEPYEVLLKPIDAVIAGCARHLRGRWVSAGSCTPGQLHDYWSAPSGEAGPDVSFVSGQAPDADLRAVSCKTHKESSKDYQKLIRKGRMGGYLFAVTGTGHVLHCSEFVGKESIPLRWFFMAQLKEKVPEWSCLIHDDSCHMKRFACKHRGRSQLAQDLSEMTFVLDRFHAASHTDIWCHRHCHPCQHKELLKDFDTSSAERVNSVLGRHKFCMRQMSSGTRRFYLQEIIETRNSMLPDGRPRPVIVAP